MLWAADTACSLPGGSSGRGVCSSGASQEAKWLGHTSWNNARHSQPIQSRTFCIIAEEEERLPRQCRVAAMQQNTLTSRLQLLARLTGGFDAVQHCHAVHRYKLGLDRVRGGANHSIWFSRLKVGLSGCISAFGNPKRTKTGTYQEHVINPSTPNSFDLGFQQDQRNQGCGENR